MGSFPYMAAPFGFIGELYLHLIFASSASTSLAESTGFLNFLLDEVFVFTGIPAFDGFIRSRAGENLAVGFLWAGRIISGLERLRSPRLGVVVLRTSRAGLFVIHPFRSCQRKAPFYVCLS